MRNELVAAFSLIHVQTGLFIHFDMPFTNGQPEGPSDEPSNVKMYE